MASTVETAGRGWPLLFIVVPEGNELCVLRGPDEGGSPEVQADA